MRFFWCTLAIAVMFLGLAVTQGPWAWFFAWPGLSFALVALAYATASPRLFGKRPNGRIAPWAVALFLPYTFLMRWAWHFARMFSKEPPSNQFDERIFIGRRLLSRERFDGIDHVIDLTCEIPQPQLMAADNYLWFPILDGHVPRLHQLTQWVDQVSELDGTLYIHCAQGHGRTGLFAAALLLKKGLADDTEEAIAKLKAVRPLVHLQKGQRRLLERYYQLLQQQQQQDAREPATV